MKLFEDFKIKFEKPDWARDPKLGLMQVLSHQEMRMLSHLQFLL